MGRRLPHATTILLAASVASFWAALWLPCLSLPMAGGEAVYSGAHLVFMTVGSIYGLATSGLSGTGSLEAWYLVPLANIVFLAAPWIWTAHPRSRVSDHAVTALMAGAGLLALWSGLNFLLGVTGLWADPHVQSLVSVFPGVPWRLEVGALAWAASAVLLAVALQRHRVEQARLLALWEARPGADELGEEPTYAQTAWLPHPVRALVIEAHCLRLELDALGPVDGWRVRLLGDWANALVALPPVDQVALARCGVTVRELAYGVLPREDAANGSATQRLAELLRIDAALRHFIAAALSAPSIPYR